MLERKENPQERVLSKRTHCRTELSYTVLPPEYVSEGARENRLLPRGTRLDEST